MLLNKVGEPKFSRLFGHFSLILLLSTSLLSAKTFEDFKRSQVESFEKYKNESDAEFSKYLKQEWKAYLAQEGTPLYEKPKPETIVPAEFQKIKSLGPKVSIKIKDIKENELELYKESKKDIKLNFYGTALGFDIPTATQTAKFYPTNQKGVTNFFNTVVSTEYEVLINDISAVCKRMNLNDWGVYLLVLDISKHTFSNPEESKLFSWFLFNKLGYAVKVGLTKNRIVLMHYSKKIIYSTPSYSFGNNKFYAVSSYNKGNTGRIYTYEQNYPDSNKPLDLSMETIPAFHLNMKSKTLHFKQFGKSYTLSYEYNQNLIDFMATYPQADYETYFNAPVDARTYNALASSLKEYIDGMKMSDALNFVLNFVQNSFAYQRDDQQFGREKVMFAEETLYYEKSDCEDRAVLFSYLVKELFGVRVVGVKYKDHMATALYIPMNGDSIKDGDKKLIIADPTYINANIGQSMPKYKSLRPESFIVVKNN